VRSATGSGPRKLVFLHIGLHKTGSSYIQSVLRANRQNLADQAVWTTPPKPGIGPNVPAWDLCGRRPRDSADRRVTGQWDVLVREVLQDPAPSALVSMEYLSLATVRQARRAVSSFDGADVHVIVTARDLGRVLVSSWQEAVKNKDTFTWEEFVAATRDPGRRAQNPARSFWLRQDLPAVLETWRAALATDHVHVVTVPPAGAPPQLLLERFGELVGFDASGLDQEPRWTNETIGVAGTELLRQLNGLLDDTLNQRQYVQVVQRTLVRELADRVEPIRFAFPEEDLPWVRAETRRMIEAVAAAGHPVLGDLEELMPAESSGSGRAPGSASDSELLAAGLAALAGLSSRYATAWWRNRRADKGAEGASASVRAGSAARGLLFRGKRAAVEAADRNRLVGKALAGYLNVRAAARRRTGR
jgi:hypothetical protein